MDVGVRDRRRLPEGLRFAVIGLLSTGITIAVFNLLVHTGEQPVLLERPIEAYVIAMAVGTIISFAGNRWWVFDAGDSPYWFGEFVRFALVNVAATALPSLCLATSRYVLDLQSVMADNISANLVGLLLATIARYWAYKILVFGTRGQAGAYGDADPEKEPSA
ncbi:GtrA family protein [Solicola gregarius]|uniref:GtrA family protein n=1 Tax=Solicola gregarius TaxID=2908642 RepID=A0AA46TFQ3_9ACTN|nr:GtrA family protein [Solicola gregarius]UYM04494.1 GtrA family protein [Solicola gregarius]